MSAVQAMRQIDPTVLDCMRDAIAVAEFPPASQSYVLAYEFTVDPETVTPGGEPGEKASPESLDLEGAPPPLFLEMWDLARMSHVSLDVATASTSSLMGQPTEGRLVTMVLEGGWTGKYVGAGASIPFAGGSFVDEREAGERWVLSNLGLWIRHAGAREVGSVVLRWGASLKLDLPTGSDVPGWDAGSYDGLPRNYFTAMGALYTDYYRHGQVYPDLEDAFKIGIRPDIAFGVLVGPMAFQVELGFDFIVLGRGQDPGIPGEEIELDNVSMLHFALGAAGRPVDWLQMTVELSVVTELSGQSGQTRIYDTLTTGKPAGSEAYVTPGVVFLLPVGDVGAGHVGVGLRIPLGEVGSSVGPLHLDPILLTTMGFRFE